MDIIKNSQQRERRAKAKAERAKYKNSPEYKEEEKKLQELIKKDKKDIKDYLNTVTGIIIKNIKKEHQTFK